MGYSEPTTNFAVGQWRDRYPPKLLAFGERFNPLTNGTPSTNALNLIKQLVDS
jgi:hypothetical protein